MENYIPQSTFLKKIIKNSEYSMDEINDLIFLEEVYLTNRFFAPLWNNFNYISNQHYPYFIWFKIDSLRTKYSLEYKSIINDLLQKKVD